MIDRENIRQWAGPIIASPASDCSDRQAVSQLVKGYALGVDMRDLTLAMSVFAADGFIEGTLGSFPSREYLPKACAAAAHYTSSQHNITNQYVSIDGDEALVWSYAIAYHMWSPELGREDLILGLQYRDQCRRFSEGWLIQHRQVVKQWQRGSLPRIGS
jgi:SnoaL-like domain